MLLVLIFALSNMGLAEVAEQVAESLPAAEPSVEEAVVEEAAPEAEQQEDAIVEAPAEDETPEAPAEGEADANDAADAEFEVSDAAVAESVSVEVQAIDVDALCAYETIEPEGAYDVSYKWERAESAEGEWTELDETSDVLKSDAEDRAAYVYRCTVTVDGISATSEPTTFDWGVEAAAEEEAAELLSEDFHAVAFNDSAEAPTEIVVGAGGANLINSSGSTKKVTLTVTDDANESATYNWFVQTSAPGVEGDDDYVTFKNQNEKSVDVVIDESKIATNNEALDKLSGKKKVIKIGVRAKVSDDVTGTPCATYADVTVYRGYTPTELEGLINIYKESAPVKEIPQTDSQDTFTYTAKVGDLDTTAYGIKWSISNNATPSFGEPATTTKGNWLSINENTGALTIEAADNDNKFTSANGQQVAVVASVDMGGAEPLSIEKSFYIRPEMKTIAVKFADGTDIDAAAKYPAGTMVLTATEDNADRRADPLKSIECVGSVKWKVKKGEAGSNETVADTDEDAKTFTFDAEGVKTSGQKYSITVSDEDDTPTVTKAVTVYPLSATAEANPAEVTIVAKTGPEASSDPATATLTLSLEDGAYDYVDEWEITANNSFGQVGQTQPYVVVDDIENQHGTTLTVKQNADVGSGTGDTPVEITATVTVKDAEGVAKKEQVKFYVTVRKTTDKQLDAANIKFKDDIAVIGAPVEAVGGSDKPEAWSQTTAYIDDTDFDGYTVEWYAATAEDQTAAGVSVNSSEYISVDKQTGVITAIGAKGREAENGVTVAVKAKILTKPGADDEGTSAYKTLKVYPAAADVSIGRVDKAAAGTVGPEVTWYTETNDQTHPLKVAKDTKSALDLLVTVNPGDASKPVPEQKIKYYGSVTRVISEQIFTDHTEPSQDLGIENGVVSVSLSNAGKFKLTAIADTCTRVFWIEVQELPTGAHVYQYDEEAAPSAAPVELPTTLYKTSNTAYSLPIIAEPYAEVAGEEVAAWSGDVGWTLTSVGGTAVQSSAVVGSDAVPDGKIYVKLEKAGDNKAELVIPAGMDFPSKQTFRLNVVPKGMTRNYPQITFSVMNKPGDDPLSGATLALESGYEDIVQGETLKVTLTPDPDKATELAKYNVEYRVVAGTNTPNITDQAKHSDWLTISRTSNTTADLKAPVAGEKNTLSNDQKTGVKFNIEAYIPGLADTDCEYNAVKLEDIPVMAMPKEVQVVYCKDDGTKISVVTGEDDGRIPVVLPKQAEIYLKGKFIPNKTADGTMDYDEPDSTHRAITLTRDTASRNFADLTAVDGHPGVYKLKATSKTGTVKITGTCKIGSTTLTDDEKSIEVIDEEPVEANNGACTSGTHIWKLKEDSSASTKTKFGLKATSAGHVYTCITCDKDSKPVAHTGKYIVLVSDGKNNKTQEPWTEADVKKLDADKKPENTGAGYIVCKVCGFQCEHTASFVGLEMTRVDSEYHTVTCPTCGIELQQRHWDEGYDGACDGCGKANVEVKLNNADEAVVIAGSEDAFEPKISLIGTAQDWSAEFKAKSGDEEYIEVDPLTGAVTGLKVKPEGAKATVEAKITVSTTSEKGGSSQTFTDVIDDWSFDVTIKNPTGTITVTSDNHDDDTNTDFVIGGKLLKLTATPANEQPQLDGYEWQLPSGSGVYKDNDADEIYFVIEDEDGTTPGLIGSKKYTKIDNIADTAEKAAALNATSILLYVTGDVANSYTGDKALKITYSNASDTDAERGEIEVEALVPLEENDPATVEDQQLKAGITFGGEYTDPSANPVKLIEGSSVELSMLKWTEAADSTHTSTPFETRYGDVKFDVEAATGSDVLSGDVSKWITVEGSTVTTKTGMLSSTKAEYKDFNITATVVIGKTTDGKEDIKAVGKRTVRIVPAPTKISFKYKKDNTGDYVAVPEAGLEVFAGDKLDLKVEIETTTNGVELSDLVWKTDPETAVVTEGTDKPVENKALGTCTYTVAQGASDFDINVGCFGKTETLHVTVKKLFTDLKISVENPKVAVGETETAADGSQSPKEIKITVQKVPADAKDTYTLHAYAVSADYKGLAGDPEPVELQSSIDGSLFQAVEGDEDSKKIIVDSDPRDRMRLGDDDYPVILIEAEAVKSTKPTTGEEEPPKVIGSTKIELYRRVTDDEAFELETAKVADASGKLVLTVGAETTITKHGYAAEAGYGSSAGMELPVVVTECLDAQNQVTTDKIVEIVGDKIIANAEGSATISIYDFNYDEDAKSGPRKDLQIEVKPAIDELIQTAEGKVKSEYEIGVGKASAATIEQSAFTATRTSEEEGAEPTPVGADEAKIELKSDDNDGVVSITDDGKGNWVIEGLKPGTVHLYAGVGSKSKSAEFTVKVGAKATGVRFVNAEGDVYDLTNNQIVREFDQLDPIELTVTGNPENAFGEVTISGATNESSEVVIEGTKVTVTPKAAGSNTITASIKNPDWDNTTVQATNPEYLTGYMTIVVLPEGEQGGDTPEPPVVSDYAIEVVDKQAIGPGEKTRVVVTGVAPNESVTWSVDPATAATIEPDAKDPKAATVTYVGAGKATVTATIGDKSVTKPIYTLTAPTKVELSSYTTVNTAGVVDLAIGESLPFWAEFSEDGGYDFTPEYKAEAEENGVYIDTTGLFTYSVNNTKALSLELDPTEGCSVKALAKKAKKDADPVLSVSVKGSSATASVSFKVGGKNTSFNIGAINGGTLYMAPGDEKTIDITTSPKSSKVNIRADIEDVDYELYDEDTGVTLTQSDKKLLLKVAEDAPENKEYKVTVSAAGYSNHANQSFTLFVQPKATAENAPILAVRKVGVTSGTGYKVNEAGITTGQGSVTVAKNEQLQAYFIDKEGSEVAGAVDWAQINKGLSKADKKKISISASGLIKVKASKGSMSLSASVGGVQATGITLNFTSAPKVELVPSETTRKVAVGEAFPLKLKADYKDTNASEWYTISFTNDLDLTIAKDEDGEDKEGVYTFEKPGTTTLSLKPVWGGKAKTVTFTVVDELADDFEVPEVVKVPSGIAAKTIVHPTLLKDDSEGGYANLTWLDGTTEIGTKEVSIGGDKNFKVKKLSDNELQISTTKNATGEKKLLVKGPGSEEGKEITIKVETATNTFPEGTALVFGKKVITIGESTTVGLDFGENEAPVGKITYSYVKKESQASASVKGNVVKASGKKAGIVTVKATIGSGKNAPSVTGTLYVVEKATIVPSQNPTKMGEDSTLKMDVTIKNYDNAKVPEQYQPVDTTGILSVETSSKQIQATLTQDEESEAPNKYLLTLKAGLAEKTSKGKFTTTTVTLRLTNGQKKAMKIQVVTNGSPYLPASITVAQGMKYTLTAATPDSANTAANLYWYFDEENAEAAAKAGLTIENGQLVASKEGTVTQEPVVLTAVDADEEDEWKIDVNVVSAKAKKGEFTIDLPNRALYAGERILATVKYNTGVGAGDVTWKSNRTSVISVDKKTGLLTVKGPSGKYTNAKITATANKKSVAQTFNVVDAPAKLEFDVTELTVAQTPGVPTTVDLTSHVMLDGKVITYKDYSNVLDIASYDYDMEDGVLTIPADAEPCVVPVYAETHNCNARLHADMVVVIGSGAGGGEVTPPTPPEKEYDAASVKLQMNGKPLDSYTQAEPLMMLENDKFTINALVYDANGESFAPKATDVKWTTDNEASVGFEGEGQDITLVAKKATVNADSINVAAKVSCEVAKNDGTFLPAVEFYVQINYAIRKENVELTLEKGSLLKGDSTTATFAIKVDSLAQQYSNYNVELVNQTEDIISIEKEGTPDTWTIKGLEVGVGKIQVIMKESEEANAKTLIDDYIVEVPVNALPTADQIQIKDAAGNDITKGTMTLGANEPGEFEVVLPEGFTPVDDDVVAEVWTIASDSTASTKLANSKDDTTDTDVKIEKKTDENGETVLLKFVVTGLTAQKKFRVVANVYDNMLPTPHKPEDCITQEFTVEVKESPTAPTDILIDATPEFENLRGVDNIEAIGNAITTAVGEPVTLTASLGKVTGTKTDLVWEKGFVWTTNFDPIPGSTEPADENNPTIETSEDGKTLTITPNSAEISYNLIEVIVALKDAPASTDAANAKRTITITVKAKPTASETGAGMLEKDADSTIKGEGASTSDPIIIGEKESVKVQVNFSNGTNPDAFTSDVTWKPSTGSISVSSETGTSTTVTGVSKTTGTVNLEAWSGSVKLGTLVFKVLAAPTAADVDLKDCDASIYEIPAENATLNRTLNDTDKNRNVAVAMGEMSATFTLESSNDHVTFKSVEGHKNVWHFVWNGDGKNAINNGDTVTLTLICKELNIRKNYNLTVHTGTTSVVPSKELQNQGVTEPMEANTPGTDIKKEDDTSLEADDVKTVVPDGFLKDMQDREGDGSTYADNPTAEGYVKNQSGVTRKTVVRPDGKEITITLSADLNDMDTWKSSDLGHQDSAKHWYVLVLDSGVAYEDWRYTTHTSGTREVAVTSSGNKPASDADLIDDHNVEDATKFSGRTKDNPVVGLPMWIDMDALALKGAGEGFQPIQFYIRDYKQGQLYDVSTWGEPYLTIKIVKGDITPATGP